MQKTIKLNEEMKFRRANITNLYKDIKVIYAKNIIKRYENIIFEHAKNLRPIRGDEFWTCKRHYIIKLGEKFG